MCPSKKNTVIVELIGFVNSYRCQDIKKTVFSLKNHSLDIKSYNEFFCDVEGEGMLLLAIWQKLMVDTNIAYNEND